MKEPPATQYIHYVPYAEVGSHGRGKPLYRESFVSRLRPFSLQCQMRYRVNMPGSQSIGSNTGYTVGIIVRLILSGLLWQS